MLANLKAALAARRIRQVDLALSLQVPPSILSEVINERRKAGKQLREAIARALQADPAWLFAAVTHIPASSQPLAGDPVNVIQTYERNGGAGSDAMAERSEETGESRQ
jgi:transcriptional regulator with XRE-family HTH domain